ncbi:thioredoxin-like protein [Obelidium mucronatum]|nr:thioredoxin-like protein [Obelidium mucronatum]
MVAKKKTAATVSTGVSNPVCYSFLCNHTTSNANACYSYNHLLPAVYEAPKAAAAKKEAKPKKEAATPSRASKRTKDAKVYKETDDENENEQESDQESEAEKPAPKKQKTASGASSTSAISVGDSIPADFPPLFTQAHSPFSLYDAAQESGLVLFFYPKANTPGCTNQACNYRDNLDAFTAKGFKVYGVSADSEKSLTNWKNKQNYQYDFISDTDKHIIKLFGLAKGASLTRSHVVIAKGGAVVHTKIPTPAKESWSDALAAIEKL